jgi:thiamine-phosphate pyrophosphorylase
MTREVPRLHAVTDDRVAALPNLTRLALAIARPGVALHARAPTATGLRHFELATLVTHAARDRRACAMVNDRFDVARAVGADGVHLPERSLPVKAVRALVGDDFLIGRSVHRADDVRRAADNGADYVFLGPIWETLTHKGRAALGVGALKGLGSIRVVAIGGVTPERVRACRDAGAWGVAAVSALWHADDPSAVAAEMLVSLGQ